MPVTINLDAGIMLVKSKIYDRGSEGRTHDRV